jgi:hypothetical protein
MNALQAFQKVQKAATILALGWMLWNLLDLVLIGVLAYLIWWKWHLGVLGVLVLLVGIWIITSKILPALFRILKKPFLEMAKSGAVRLAVLGAIDDDTVVKLADTEVEYWPGVIASSMTNEEFQKRILGL